MRKWNALFAVLVKLVVVFLVGAIAYVIVSSLSYKLDRQRRNRSLADMRSIATALETRATDTKSFNIGPRPLARVGTSAESFGTMQRVSFEELQRALNPTYMRKLPRLDGWNTPFDVRIGNYDAQGRARSYAIRSLGKDRLADAERYKRGFVRDFNSDLVFSDGVFIRGPEGM